MSCTRRHSSFGVGAPDIMLGSSAFLATSFSAPGDVCDKGWAKITYVRTARFNFNVIKIIFHSLTDDILTGLLH